MIDKILFAAYNGIGRLWTQISPRPGDVLDADFGLRRLSPDEWRILQDEWCRRWSRDPVAGFEVHDGCHYLLDAPPTADGEGLVLSFQLRYMMWDENAIGFFLYLMMCGLASWHPRPMRRYLEMTRRQIPFMEWRIATALSSRLLQEPLARY